MSADGQNFACTACHVTRNHVWAGSRYDVIAKDIAGAGRPGMVAPKENASTAATVTLSMVA